MTLERLMTVEELAKRWQVKDITVLRYIKAGKLKATQIGKSYRIYPRDVIEFERSKYNASANTDSE